MQLLTILGFGAFSAVVLFGMYQIDMYFEDKEIRKELENGKSRQP